VDGQQAQLLSRRREQPNFHAAPHIVIERNVPEFRTAGKRHAATDGEAVVLHRDAPRKAELVVRKYQPRGFGAVDFLQRDDIGIQRARVPAQRRDVLAAARQLVRDFAGHGATRAVTRGIRRHAGRRQCPQRFRFHEPLEIPGGEFQFLRWARRGRRAREQNEEGGDEPGMGMAGAKPDWHARRVSHALPGATKKKRGPEAAHYRGINGSISASRPAYHSSR